VLDSITGGAFGQGLAEVCLRQEVERIFLVH
jgi:hypothetical protein